MDFFELHRQPTPLLLPNAWDVPSALAFVDAGFPAIGTTSFGVAASLGRPDAGRVTRDANLALTRALNGIPAHLSVDIEDGYSDEAGPVADYVDELDKAGAAGVNIEDSTDEALIDPAVHAAKLAAIKQRTPRVFLNARVDTYWLGEQATPEATLQRAERYVEAGADGVFVPGATDLEFLAKLTAALSVPVNVLALPGRSVPELAALGVRRISTGSMPYRAAVQAAVTAAQAVADHTPLPASVPYAELQERLRRFHHR